MSGGMWERLGGLREVVREGLQDFTKEALRETTIIKASVVDNVAPVTAVAANALQEAGKAADLLGRRRRRDQKVAATSEGQSEGSSTASSGPHPLQEEQGQAPEAADTPSAPASEAANRAAADVRPEEASSSGGPAQEASSTDSAGNGAWALDAGAAASGSASLPQEEGEEEREGVAGEGWDSLSPISSPVGPGAKPVSGRQRGDDATGVQEEPLDAESAGDAAQTTAGVGEAGDVHAGSLPEALPAAVGDAESQTPAGGEEIAQVEGAGACSRDAAPAAGPRSDVVSNIAALQGGSEGAAPDGSGSPSHAPEEAGSRPRPSRLLQAPGSSSEGAQEARVGGGAEMDAGPLPLQQNEVAPGAGPEPSQDNSAAETPREQVAGGRGPGGGEEGRGHVRAGGDEERLEALCTQLRSSLEEAVEEKESVARQLARLEDELESERAQGTRQRAEIQGLREAAEEAAGRHRGEAAELSEKLQGAEERAAKEEALAAAARKERESLEQRVKAMAATLEKRMQALTEELQARQGEVAELREENEGMQHAFAEVRAMLKDSVEERKAVRQLLAEREGELAQAGERLEQREAALAVAEAEVEAARREAAESGVALADAKAEVWAVREAAQGNALGEDERQQLEAALKAMSASAHAAAAEVAEWREKAAALDQQGRAKTKLLGERAAEVAALRQRAAEVAAELDEATRQRAQAEGASEQLREQAERRARTFNAAVKAAVTKFQAELEAERDGALERVQMLEQEVQARAQEAAQLQKNSEAAESARRAAERGLEEQVQARVRLDRDLAEAREGEQSVIKRAHVAAAASASKVAALEARCREGGEALERARAEAAEKEAAAAAECERLKELMGVAEREKTHYKVEALEVGKKAAEDVAAMRGQVAELEQRLQAADGRAARLAEVARSQWLDVAAVGASGAAKGGPSKAVQRPAGGAHEDLDLEGLLGRAAGQSFDIEAGEGSADTRKRAFVGKQPAAVALKRAAAEEPEKAASGRISRRSFILIIYIVVLHMMVMYSFTRQSCGEAGREAQLPGR